MRTIVLILLLAIAGAVQGCWLTLTADVRFRPDLFLIVAVFVALEEDRSRVPWMCWLVGLGRDVFSVGPLGLSALLYCLVGLAICVVREEIYREHVLTRSIVTFVAGLLVGICEVLIMRLFYPYFPVRGAAGYVAISAAETAALAMVVMWILRRIFARLRAADVIYMGR